MRDQASDGAIATRGTPSDSQCGCLCRLTRQTLELLCPHTCRLHFQTIAMRASHLLTRALCICAFALVGLATHVVAAESFAVGSFDAYSDASCTMSTRYQVAVGSGFCQGSVLASCSTAGGAISFTAYTDRYCQSAVASSGSGASGACVAGSSGGSFRGTCVSLQQPASVPTYGSGTGSITLFAKNSQAWYTGMCSATANATQIVRFNNVGNCVAGANSQWFKVKKAWRRQAQARIGSLHSRSRLWFVLAMQ